MRKEPRTFPPTIRFVVVLLSVLLVSVAFLLTACGGEKVSREAPTEVPSEPPELVPVPEPDLASAEPEVRRQIQEFQKKIETLQQDPVTDASDLATFIGTIYGELGLVYQAYDLLDSAEACYENARRLEPGDFLWSYAAGRLARDHRGDLNAAVSAFEAAVEGAGFKMKTAALIHLGHTYLELGDLEKAEDTFRKVLAEAGSSKDGNPGDGNPEDGNPKDGSAAAAHDGLGRVAVAAKDSRAAIDHFRQSLALQPEASRVAYRLGQALRREGRLEEAKAALEGQGSREVSFPDPFEKLLANAGTGTTALLRRGAQAQLAGRFDIAEKFYRQAVEASPENPAAHLSLGAALTHQGDVAGAVEHYQIAARLQPGNPVPPYNLGHLMIRSGDLDQAEKQFETALEIEAGHLEARLGLASVAERRQDFPGALARYDRLLQDHPGNLEARSRRAVVLASSGRQHQALEELRSIVATAPKASEPWLHLGTLLAQLGRMDEARNALTTALEKGLPPEPKARAESFLAKIEAGPSGAMSIETGQTQTETSNLAQAYATATELLRQGRSTQARDLLEEALPKYPGSPQLALTLARVLAAAPDPEARNGQRALDLAQAIHRVLNSPESGEVIAMALAELGQFEEATQWQQKILTKIERAGNPTLKTRLQENLKRYQKGQKAANPWEG